ncbi:MAG TPA: 16S rRNA (guanine(966)-N(2))-methyltransferase RsmD [Candidatus Dormibacteraeota bacterium]
MGVKGPGRLRIEGGEDRGRRLTAPAGIRPTQGMVKQAIFNLLGVRVLEAQVLDLFSGSGALGIEALSRGAAGATFVESSEAAVAAIRVNLAAVGYLDRARVVRGDAVWWVRGHPVEVARHKLVLLDPPYADPVLETALAALDAVVAVGTLVVAERASASPVPALARLTVDRDRRYGGSSVTILVAH